MLRRLGGEPLSTPSGEFTFGPGSLNSSWCRTGRSSVEKRHLEFARLHCGSEGDLGLTEFADELRNTHLLLQLHYVYASKHLVLIFAIIRLLF